jgi:hypothetical protein
VVEETASGAKEALPPAGEVALNLRRTRLVVEA